ERHHHPAQRRRLRGDASPSGAPHQATDRAPQARRTLRKRRARRLTRVVGRRAELEELLECRHTLLAHLGRKSVISFTMSMQKKGYRSLLLTQNLLPLLFSLIYIRSVPASVLSYERHKIVQCCEGDAVFVTCF